MKLLSFRRALRKWIGPPNYEQGSLAWLMLLASCVLVHPGCDAPNVELGGRRLVDAALSDASARDDSDTAHEAPRGDETEQNDEDEQEDEGPDDALRPCVETLQCVGEERLCDVAHGYCVECLSDADCDPDQRCEDDGECD